MKKETLEEASLLSRPIHLIWDEDERYDCNEEFREEFKKGAKWQQEQSYSKEDVNHLEWIYNRMISLHNENKDYDYMVKFKEILDQFKNKIINGN